MEIRRLKKMDFMPNVNKKSYFEIKLGLFFAMKAINSINAKVQLLKPNVVL